MDKHFTHLHLHTDYSLLDGAITIDALVNFGKQHNFKALAMTDHGNIFGAVKFFKQAKKAGIKPILGMEAYFTQDVSVKNADNKYHHLILLVENEQGYKNLCKLIAFSYQEGFYFKPRIDYARLEKYSEGLIATSACLGGHIPSLLMQNNYEAAEERIDWFLNVFGPDRFYLEVQPDDAQDQKILNEKLFALSKKRGISCVAAGDCHYLTADDREAHEVMLSIQTQHKITDPNRFTFGDCRVHVRTTEEMLAVFAHEQEAVWTSGKIADRCNFDFQTGKLFFPQFQLPEEYTQDQYFRELCKKGLKKLFDTDRIEKECEQAYYERLELEMDLIIKVGFVGYFLVVSDFIMWAREQDIPVGPGRGSAAGSLVAWSLQITDIDPIRYNLLFERFLNPERVSMPDIDIDFCIEGRDLVIQYVRDKYGHDKVSQIITFGTMLAKGVIKDVARVLGFPFEDSNALTDLIPDQLKITLKEAFEQEPKFAELVATNPKIAKLFDLAKRLEGVTRHASKHAAGIVISPDPISDVLPVYVPPKSTELVTQYAMTELESLGFLKMDFLGLKNLTLIQRVVKLIHEQQALLIDIPKIPLDDLLTFRLLSRGETSGVFQLESNGLKDVLRRLQPASFEDVIAVNALYRPGPLGSGMVDDFIERKHGRQKISYLFNELEPILKETYGVIVYQEQVMKIASAIAGYTLGESDLLRRAMGKKKAEEMAAQKSIFVEKSLKRGFPQKESEELFELMAYFAGYGFNKSHSAAYALIAYHTAYLKANYPAEFLACLISLEASHGEQMAFYIHEARDRGITVLQPDINRSQVDFSIEEGAIRFGLHGIKNVGLAALHSIISERKKGPFKDLFDFCKRLDLRTCNKRVLENLICAGALDSLSGNRHQKIEELPLVLDKALEKKKAEKTGQMGLFDILTPEGPVLEELHVFALRPEWSDTIKLEKEKEALGVYISAQPLDMYTHHITALRALSFEQAAQHPPDALVTCCGSMTTHKVITTKKGDKMAFAFFEDYVSKAEIVIFPKLFAKIEPFLSEHTIFVIKGNVENTPQGIKIKAQSIIPIDLIFQQGTCTKITFQLPDMLNKELLNTLKDTWKPGAIPVELVFKEHTTSFILKTKERIAPDYELLLAVKPLAIETFITLT